MSPIVHGSYSYGLDNIQVKDWGEGATLGLVPFARLALVLKSTLEAIITLNGSRLIRLGTSIKIYIPQNMLRAHLSHYIKWKPGLMFQCCS